MGCSEKVSKAIINTCDNAPSAGLELTAYLFDRLTTTFILNQSTPNLVTGIVLGAGQSAYKVIAVKRETNAGFDLITADVVPDLFTHTVSIQPYDRKSKAIKGLDEMDDFVAVVEIKAAKTEGKFIAFGLGSGLHPNSASGRYNDNYGIPTYEFGTREGEGELYSRFIFWDTDYSTTKYTLEQLSAEVLDTSPDVASVMSEDQEWYIPDNAETGDYLGECGIYPEYKNVGAAPTFSISGGTDASLFDISPSTGLMTIEDVSGLTAGDYTFNVTITKPRLADTEITITVHCIAASNIDFYDFAAETNGTGTRISPKNTLPQYGGTSGTAGDIQYYMLKRGTTYNGLVAWANKEYMIMDAYGQGTKPHITYNGSRVFNWSGMDNCKVRNLTFSANNVADSNAFYTGGGASGSATTTNNMYAEHCEMKEAEWGVRVLGVNVDNVRFNFCEIHHTLDDGAFCQRDNDSYITNLIWNGCYIHHVNQDWVAPETSQEIAGGDGIQMEPVDNFVVKNCMIDRSDTGNKFCIIAKRTKGECIIENNYLINALYSGSDDNGTILYIAGVPNLKVRYNKMLGATNAVQLREDSDAGGSYSTGVDFYGNIVYNNGYKFDYAINSLTASYLNVFNNTFLNGRWNHYTYSSAARSTTYKNNIFHDVLGDYDEYSTSLTMDYNLYSGGTTRYSIDDGTHSIDGAAIFIDSAHNDYRLDAGSDGINDGETLTDWTVDFEGNIVSSPPNIGFSELYGN